MSSWADVPAVLADLSEDAWSASWLDGIEGIAWSALLRYRDGQRDFQMGALAGADAVPYLEALSAMVDAGLPWAEWDDDEGEVVAVPIGEWREQWEERQAASAAEAERLEQLSAEHPIPAPPVYDVEPLPPLPDGAPIAVSAFSGIGLLDLGLHQAGFDTAVQIEWDAAASRVLAARFPRAVRFGDVRSVDGDAVRRALGGRRADLLSGGFPCFPDGTLILTRRGLVPIEDVVANDEVLTHRNRWRKVVRNHGSHDAPTVELRGQGGTLRCTPNHPLWSTKRGRRWLPRVRGRSRPTETTWTDPSWRHAEDMVGWHWASPATFPDDEVPTAGTYTGERSVNVIDAEAAWCIGRWLADGCLNRSERGVRGIRIVCGIGEAGTVRARLADARWHATETPNATPSTYRFTVSSMPLARWLRTHFGEHSHGKTIPAWALGAPAAWRRALLDGYMSGDGCRTQGQWKATTVSRSLALGMRLLAQSLGYSVSVHYSDRPATCVIEGRTVNQRATWQVVIRSTARSSHEMGGHRYGSVRRVERAGTRRVWNIEVDEDHSYIADGFVAKNCQDVSVAGGRSGLAGDRSSLYTELVRLADELDPDWLVVENVPGLLSADSDPDANGGRECREHLAAELAAGRRGRCRHPVLAETGSAHGLGRGTAFALVLGDITGYRPPVPEGGWRSSGVCSGPRRTVAWRLLDAQFFGVAQRRRRVFLVAHPRDRAAPAGVLLEPDRDSGNPPPGAPATPRSARPAGDAAVLAGVAAADSRGAGGAGADSVADRRDGRADPAGIAEVVSTLTAGGDGRGWRLDAESAAGGHIVPLEYNDRVVNTLLAGGNDKGEPDKTPYAVTVVGTVGTLQTQGRRADGDSADAGQIVPMEDEPLRTVSPTCENDDRVAWQGQGGNVGPLGTLRAGDGTVQSGVPFVTEPAADPRDIDTRLETGGAVAFDWQAGDGSGDDSWAGKPRSWQVKMGDYAGALSTTKVQAVAYRAPEGEPRAFRKSERARTPDDGETWVPADVANTLNPFDASSARTTHAVVEDDATAIHITQDPISGPQVPALGAKSTGQGVVTPGTAVRRLTPVECERLQGAPDGWTAVDGARDSARYKQLGNAVPVPVAAWIGWRIKAWMDGWRP